MADLPAALKTGDIPRFSQRAVQLEKFKPVISYWCLYHVVNLILNQGLHTTDDACMAYTTTIMDKLEKIKSMHAEDSSITDEIAAKAYVEQFALETFQRADNSVAANSVTAQTADTFRAAATFIDLVSSTWPPSNPELTAKSKYAKYHALRIAKALKAGEDPNASNPPPPSTSPHPTSPGVDAPPLSPNDPEVMAINSASTGAPGPGGGEAAPVSPITPPAGSPPPQPPRLSAPATSEETDGQTGYFPTVPTFTSESSAPVLAPEDEMDHQPTITASPMAPDPSAFYSSPQAPIPPVAPPSASPAAPPLLPQTPVTFPNPNPVPAPAPISAPPPQESPARAPGQHYVADDDAIMAAQKHARWAVSALNFEDVDTAVKELRTALRSLGAS